MLERRDFEWGGRAWTRPILPRPPLEPMDLAAVLREAWRALPELPNPLLRFAPQDMGAMLDRIEWRWPDA